MCHSYWTCALEPGSRNNWPCGCNHWSPSTLQLGLPNREATTMRPVTNSLGPQSVSIAQTSSLQEVQSASSLCSRTSRRRANTQEALSSILRCTVHPPHPPCILVILRSGRVIEVTPYSQAVIVRQLSLTGCAYGDSPLLPRPGWLSLFSPESIF